MKFGMQKLAVNSPLHAKFEANRRSFEIRGPVSGLMSFVEFTSKEATFYTCPKGPSRIASITASRGVYPIMKDRDNSVYQLITILALILEV